MSHSFGFQADINKAIRTIIEQACTQLKIEYSQLSKTNIQLAEQIGDDQLTLLKDHLSYYGITLHEQSQPFVDQIKAAISDMINNEESTPTLKTSTYLEKKLLKSYSSISRSFKEETYMSIENYIILQKLERAKELIMSDLYTLTEIAHKLNYSSVAHLSNQFKKATGLSASSFVRIMNKRKEALHLK